MATDYANLIVESGKVGANDIVILTPYKMQAEKLREKLRNVKLNNINVSL